MTVAELIKLLQAVNEQDALVVFDDDGDIKTVGGIERGVLGRNMWLEPEDLDSEIDYPERGW